MRKFSGEEINQIIRTAQIFAPQFTEEQYGELVQMQQEMGESEFIKAAWGVHRLQKQYGIPSAQAPDQYDQLVKDIAGLNLKIVQLQNRRALDEKELAVAQQALRQVKEKRSAEEKELVAFRQQAEEEKECLRQELEKARKEARVKHDQIGVAGEINAIVKSHGLKLELTLPLLAEFAREEEPAERLAQAVVEYSSLQEALQEIKQQNEAQQAELDKAKQESDQLKTDCLHNQEVLAKLKSNIAEEQALRKFHKRFSPSSPALEYLAQLGPIILLRCTSVLCSARFWVNHGPSNFRTAFVCPCCGLTSVHLDGDAYKALGVPAGTAIQVILEE